jgi:hypothetical protein
LRAGADAHKYTAERTEFANAFLGIAALIVMLGHYVLVFNAMRGGYSHCPSRYCPLLLLLHSTIFFLVSGLVIPISVDKLGNVNDERTSRPSKRCSPPVF